MKQSNSKRPKKKKKKRNWLIEVKKLTVSPEDEYWARECVCGWWDFLVEQGVTKTLQNTIFKETVKWSTVKKRNGNVRNSIGPDMGGRQV